VLVAGTPVVMGRVTVFRRLLKASRRAMHMLHGVMPGGFAAQDHLLLHTSRPDGAQHGGSHRTPGGEQPGQQQQEPDANGFHEGSINRCLSCQHILNLPTVTKSRETLPPARQPIGCLK
jgi:hypothetical protein